MTTPVIKQLNELQAGDTVIYFGGGINTLREVVKIDRVTKTQIIVRAFKYNRITGRPCGDGYRSGSIHVPDPGEVEEIQNEHTERYLRRKLRDTDWDSIPLQQLEKIVQLLPTKP